jgi:hypothetical protein
MIQAIQLSAQLGSVFGNELALSVIHHHSSNKADVKFSREDRFRFRIASPVHSPAVMENINVPKFNEQKKTLGQKTPSDQEIWSAIRYLDFEIDEKPSACNAIIALAVALLIICVTVCLLRARGL